MRWSRSATSSGNRSASTGWVTLAWVAGPVAGDVDAHTHYDRRMENEDIVEALADEDAIEEELLIEEISIDGMCGVY